MNETNLQESLESVQEETQNQEQQQEQPQQESSEQTAQKQSDAERNLANLRQQKEQLQRERDELKQRMEAIENHQNQQQQKSSKKEDTPQLADDDLVEWKYVRQQVENLEQKMNQYQNMSTAAAAEARLKARYNDFDTVVTKDNIDKLREKHPEIAASISSSQDIYTQGAAAYDVIKRYGIYQDETYKADKEKVHENASKPQSMNASSGQRGDSPLDKANAFSEGLTPELKDKLYKEMIESIKKG